MRRPRTLLARVLVPSAAAVVALPLVSGCQTNAGAAAFVGNTKIATSDLTAMAQRSQSVLSASAQAQGATPVAVQRNDLSLLITAQLLDRVGRTLGVTPSDADVRAFQAQQEAQNGAQLGQQLTSQGIAPQDQPLVFRVQLLAAGISARIGEAQGQSTKALALVVQESQRAKVRVNPRFGSWDAAQLRVQPPAGDLSSTPGTPSTGLPTGS